MSRGFENDPKSMSILDHLGELRMVLVHVFVFLLAGILITWAGSGYVLDWIIGRLSLDHVQFLAPMEPFNARFQVALLLGLGLSMPFMALRTWSFVVPALRIRERRVILPSAIATWVLFLGGAAFALLFLAPFMLKFLLGFGTEKAVPGIALGPTLSFVFRMAIACAVLFQMPLVLALLTYLGVVTPRRLLGWWRHAVVVIFILSAAVTPGDGPSQIALAVPLTVLYFFSVLVSWFVARPREEDAVESDIDPRDSEPRDPEPRDPEPRDPEPPVPDGLRRPTEPPTGTAGRRPGSAADADTDPETGDSDGESPSPPKRAVERTEPKDWE